MISFFRMPKTGSSYVHRKLRKTNIEIIEHLSVQQAQSEIIASDKVFCFVRNPYQRFHSAYNYIQCNGNGNEIDARAGHILRQYSQRDFLEVLPILLKRHPKELKHFTPQHKWIMRNGKIIVDSVGKYENIEKDYKKLKDKFGFKDVKPVFKKTEKYPVTYPELIRWNYRKDFSYFGY